MTSLIDSCSSDIIFGTKTWFSSDILDAELTISREFTIYRKNMLGKQGGGAILAVRMHVPSSLILIKSSLEKNLGKSGAQV